MSDLFTDISDMPSDVTTFIVAPREISEERFIKLIKKYLPKGPLCLGLAKEAYVSGFDDQPQFKTLQLPAVRNVLKKVLEHSPTPVYVLHYAQDELSEVAATVGANYNVFVRGSWQYTLHTQPIYSQLKAAGQKVRYESPFVDEAEAKQYAIQLKLTGLHKPEALKTEADFSTALHTVARRSFDHSFQVGSILARRDANGNYSFVRAAHNEVVPYETYAMHHGFAREDNKAPSQDLNHYDTVHAETMLMIRSSPEELEGGTLFLNLMPCKTCARGIVASGIAEVYYMNDHSGGYAVELFKASNITTRKVSVC